VVQQSTPQTSASDETIDDSDYKDVRLSKAPVNLVHLELLYHFQTETCKIIAQTSELVDIYRTAVVKGGLANPCLMHEILALSAFHLSLERPTGAVFYRNMALDLRSQALAEFHQVLLRLDATTCVDGLLFSHTLALHVFCETFTLLRDDFSAFLSKLTDCISMLMGIHIVLQPWWDTISTSPIGALTSESRLRHESSKRSYGECLVLRDLIDQSDVSPASATTCHEALDRLQRSFDVERSLEDATHSTSMVFGWLVTSEPNFRALIEARQPEALILLAYYAVILDKRRKAWAVRDSGQWLLASITTYLGERWERWLAWPNSVVNANDGSKVTSSSISPQFHTSSNEGQLH
jgi:hypothetical protein